VPNRLTLQQADVCSVVARLALFDSWMSATLLFHSTGSVAVVSITRLTSPSAKPSMNARRFACRSYRRQRHYRATTGRASG
jgi:hypothetical protein